MDVPACNVVIRYDDVKNEISMVQSRGRARAMEAHEVVIGESQTIEKHEVMHHQSGFHKALQSTKQHSKFL